MTYLVKYGLDGWARREEGGGVLKYEIFEHVRVKYIC